MEATLRRTEYKEHEHDAKVGDQVDTVIRDLRDLGRLAGTRVKRKLIEATEDGARLCGRMGEKSRRVVEHRPLASVAAAAGLGALVAGLLLGRR